MEEPGADGNASVDMNEAQSAGPSNGDPSKIEDGGDPHVEKQQPEGEINSDHAESVQDFDPSVQDETAALRNLAATARDQDDLEKDIGRQADQMLLEQADDRDQKRLEKTESQKEKLVSQVRKLQQRLQQRPSASSVLRIRAEINHLQPQIDALDKDLEQIQKRIDGRHHDENAQEQDGDDKAGAKRQPGETRRDFLIRTGKITPFARMGQNFHGDSANLADVMLDAEGGDSDRNDDQSEDDAEPRGREKLMSHRNLLRPGFIEDDTSQAGSSVDDIHDRPRKRRKAHRDHAEETISRSEDNDGSEEEYRPEDVDPTVERLDQDSESDDWGFVAQGNDQDGPHSTNKRKTKRRRHRATGNEDEDTNGLEETVQDLAGVDDGDERVYSTRLRKWITERKAARRKAQAKSAENAVQEEHNENAAAEDSDEWLMPHPTRPDTVMEGDFKVPGDIYPSLFDYQKTGVQWLWELYSQKAGGIIGDEMGLGKTIQIIGFLASLHHSNLLHKPVIVVTPATVMKQWVNEFHQWWPPLRVSILHGSGSGLMDVRKERNIEDDLEFDNGSAVPSRHNNKRAKAIVDRVVQQGHVLVTTYSGLQSYAALLLPVHWGYAVLDEGHKIRNPNAKITIFSKSLRTVNRVILSGTPMQNNLTELWSLFDFVFPLLLGNLVNFRTQFEMPIKHGGYANASNLQVETALKCAETLKDAISPYLLQRFKIDVAADLPKKSEQVLFCRLTKTQREAYESFLASPEMDSILTGRRRALYGIDILRKICNHPDLVDHRKLSIQSSYNYGNPVKSGKMQVVKALLHLWRDTGHKTLLFAQHRIMLDILERFVRSQGNLQYRRMDGETQIKDRQDLVDEFNRDPNIHVFLLTTKVGGLGVNLTGADRVIIFDPDWNPSTDMQARERAWRLGQQREVMIYRLMTAGTIEEKIYHRQIFKQFLTNKILRDPKQRQTFQFKDLHDLFTLGNADEETETSTLFQNTKIKFDKVAASAGATETNAAQPEPAEQPEPDDTNKINNIVGISHLEDYQGDSDANTAKQASTEPTSDQSPKATSTKDTRILSSIFSKADVHSTVSHEEIINGRSSSSKKITADPTIISREAKKVAAAAAEQLRRAGETARSVPIGTPTWTGEHGTGGRPASPPPRRGAFSSSRGRGGSSAAAAAAASGPSSSSMLANLSARQGPTDMPSSADAPAPDSTDSGSAPQQPRGRAFMALIRDYLLSHGGAVYTQMLIDHFNRFCATPERTAEFKEMLRAIAVLERGQAAAGSRADGPQRGRGIMAMRRERERARNRGAAGGRGKWVLKREFGGTA